MLFQPQSTTDCLEMVLEMIEEAQREANLTMREPDKSLILAKRDALTEVKFRLRDGVLNPRWTRRSSFAMPL